MSETKVTLDTPMLSENDTSSKTASPDKPTWVTPKLEDVSEEVMAQPYIRFT